MAFSWKLFCWPCVTWYPLSHPHCILHEVMHARVKLWLNRLTTAVRWLREIIPHYKSQSFMVFPSIDAHFLWGFQQTNGRSSILLAPNPEIAWYSKYLQSKKDPSARIPFRLSTEMSIVPRFSHVSSVQKTSFAWQGWTTTLHILGIIL